MQGVSTPIPSMNIFVWGSQSGKCRYFRLHEKYMRTWPLVVVLNTAMCPPGARYTRLKIGEVGSTGSNRGQQPRPHLKTNNKNPLVQVSSWPSTSDQGSVEPGSDLGGVKNSWSWLLNRSETLGMAVWSTVLKNSNRQWSETVSASMELDHQVSHSSVQNVSDPLANALKAQWEPPGDVKTFPTHTDWEKKIGQNAPSLEVSLTKGHLGLWSITQWRAAEVIFFKCRPVTVSGADWVNAH